MAYAVASDLIEPSGGHERYAQLFGAADGTIDLIAVQSAIDSASAEIDSYAAARYAVPIADPVPAIVREKCAEIAVLKRFRARGMLSTEHRERWEAVFSSDERSPGWLLQLRSGLVTPGVDPMPARHSTMAPEQATSELAATRDVSRAKLGGFW